MRRKVSDDRLLLKLLAEGKRPKEMALEFGCHIQTVRARLSRYVAGLGCKTPEQAVALYVADKIRAELPLALQGHVERALR